MNPEVWGPNLWNYMHSLALSYPDIPNENDKKYYGDFFNNLKYTLPCITCRSNYIKHIKELPVENSLNSRVELFCWTVNMHNKVNIILNKKTYSCSDAIKLYNDIYTTNEFKEQFATEEPKGMSKFLIIGFCILTILIISIIVILIYKKK